MTEEGKDQSKSVVMLTSPIRVNKLRSLSSFKGAGGVGDSGKRHMTKIQEMTWK